MTVRHAYRRAIARSSVCRFAAAASLAFVLGGLGGGATGAQAATVDAASAPAGASAPLAAGSQYSIHPGQSLNDVAIAATQSHDRATLARASKALFDANPNAFMSHDPSRLRLGSVLTIPALDATGAAIVASDAAVAPAPLGAAASSAVAASASSAAASPATAATAPAASTAVSAASQPASGQANAASAAMQAAPAVSGPASAAVQASSATAAGAGVSAPLAGSGPAMAASGAVSGAASAPAGVSSTAVAPSVSQAVGAHVWTGSIQPATGASVASAASASATLPVTPSSAPQALQAPTQVSSLQQLLALKSRVLLELQKHGIGGKPAQPASASGPATVESSPAVVASGTHVQSTGAVASSHTQSGGFDLSPVNLGFAAAIGAAAVALLAALGMRRRASRVTSAEVAGASETEAVAGPETVLARDNFAPHDEIGTSDPVVAGGYAAREAAAGEAAAREEAATREAVEREAAAQQAVEREAAAREAAAHEEAAAREAAEREAAAHQAAEREAAAREAAAHEEAAARELADREATARQIAEHEAAAHDAASHEEAASHEVEEHEAAVRKSAESETAPYEPADHTSAPFSFEDTTASADHAPVIEPGTDALRPDQFHPAIEHPSHPAPAGPNQWTEPAEHPSEESAAEEPPLERNEPPHPQMDFGAPAPLGEPQTGSSFGQHPAEPSLYHTGAPQPLPSPPQLEPEWGEPLTPQASESVPHGESLSPEAFPPSAHEQPSAPETFEQALHEAANTDQQPDALNVEENASPAEQPLSDAPAEPAAASSFPRDAVDAFGSLDMALPPRTEPVSPATPVTPPASLSTQPVVEPEITAQHAFMHGSAGSLPAAEEIAAGTAGPAAVAGLGAAGFGALNLDFDLELPPSPAQPLPSFTPHDLVRIARNKLDLASEYIELGDLAGARALIQEVIDTNDAATRSEARALLSTLRPLS
ncbi:FimV/HubP family polar landmark protein [Paraburkholderia sp. GAS82]|uniref:FimV/HubP family polar landmark protein n=1 Tax=Paraburkholderia sp. GAS82 TaxID=3035137 RepID=UPI003D1E9463